MTRLTRRILFVFILLSVCLTQIHAQEYDPKTTDQKFNYALQLIRFAYLEKVNEPKIVDKAIVEMLKELDPHSIYISKEELTKMNEPLEGKFDGIGVQFQIVKDTIVVVDVVTGGPSEKLGIMAGDKMVTIDGKGCTGDTINNSYVLKNLRGKKGTIVKVGIVRKSRKGVMEFNITRDVIPLTSIDAIFMAAKEVGYIRLDRFSRTSMDEFRKALADLKAQGMKSLILDLRENSGGYLDVAIDLADEFLDNDKMVVYTEGVSSPRQEYKSTDKGGFERGKLVVMIDEGSASASEIVSGAIQDWDRGLIVGRRSFGKGLVQRPYDLPDGSVIRLTTSKYFTPSGRWIQKPYTDGLENYYKDALNRYNNGELVNPEKIHFPDSLKYKTNNKRTVYGGGGIMPDIFIPMDTSKISDYFVDLRRKNVLNNFVMDYIDKNRESLKMKYPKFADFQKGFQMTDEFMSTFTAFAEKEGVKRTSVNSDKLNKIISQYYDKIKTDTTLSSKYKNYQEIATYLAQNNDNLNKEIAKSALKEDESDIKAVENSEKYIRVQLKALFARNLYDINSYYQVVRDIDDAFTKAVEIIQNDKLFDKLKVSH
ncbi:MAG: S41 family peptidase [Bacteroidota bacterium]